MKHWKSILLLLLVFGAGVAVGVVGTRAAVRQYAQRAIAQPERIQNLAERDLARELQLDKKQRAQVHEILSQTRAQLRDLRLQVQPQMMLATSNATAQISALLTPDQRLLMEKSFAAKNLFGRPPRMPGQLPPRMPPSNEIR